MNKYNNEIINKVKKIKKILIISMALMILFFVFSLLLLEFTKIDIVNYYLYTLLFVALPSLYFVARCPNCGCPFGRALIPKNCPRCKATLI